MVLDERVRELLAVHGRLRPQAVDEWGGASPLPEPVADYFLNIGPVDVTIESYGNPYFLPSLSRLWEFQAGYRYHPTTGERFAEWDDEWLVVADEGGDAFVYYIPNKTVLFAPHGEGVWKPEEIFPDIKSMAACLAVLGTVIVEAGDHFCDEECYVRPGPRAQAVSRLREIVGSKREAESVLECAGWA